MSLNKLIENIKSDVAEVSFMTLYGKTADELANEMIPASSLNFFEFMEIAKKAKAMDIIECWDQATFNFYVSEFGPMTCQEAIDLCYFTETMSREEELAGEYFSKR